MAVPLPHAGGGDQPLSSDAFADVCYDCGMVTLFVRLSDTMRARALESAADEKE